MTRLAILSSDERKAFDSPPVFNEAECQQYLTLTPEIKSIVNALQTPTNQVGFLLQLAYFQKEQRFYAPKLFRTADIDFATMQLEIDKTSLDWPRYKERIIQEHRQKIRCFFEVMPFTNDEQQAMKLKTPKIEKVRTTKIAQLLAESGFVSILDILETVQQATGFLDGFKHYSIKHSKPRPSPRIFFAGIIGEGCNLGSHKLAQISRGVSRTVLDNVINWYLDKDSLARVNRRLIALIDKLHLPTLFKKEAHVLHTSSDGKKHLIRVDSLNANYSFKYFGSGKGVSIYHFLDERSLLFHVPVISSAEREAGYVVDGLAHNQAVKSDVHSTDTHGFSEIIFAITYFLGIIFAPRIKKVLYQQLYAFKSKKHYAAKGYAVLPDRYVDVKRIEDNWEDMLRLIATIKLKHAAASQIFKRLSSYSKEHPLYQALKAFGRIIKSLFILEYIDDVELRQAIQKQLNKVELSHKFSNAVFFADNQEFKQSTPEEQARAAGCKCLIQNAIVVWNYLYLSHKLANCSDAKEKTALLKSMKKGSIMTWHHANLHGEYDFTEKPAASNIQFDLDKILALRLD